MTCFVRFGVWAWGGVTVALAIAALLVVFVGAFSIPSESCNFDRPGDFKSDVARLFYGLKENGSLVAGILGFSGLAWSNFFKTYAAMKGVKAAG